MTDDATEDDTPKDKPNEQLVEGREVHENGAVSEVFRAPNGELMIAYWMPIPVVRGVKIESKC